jgi:hypothetical protein
MDKLGEWIYRSMLERVFVEYCDLAMTFIDEEKYKRVQEIGRLKAHTQKSRAKTGLTEITDPETFILGCYEELRIQLLRQLYRMLGDVDDYKRVEGFLTEKVNEEKKEFKKVLKRSNK